jgi:hypothetical protein
MLPGPGTLFLLVLPLGAALAVLLIRPGAIRGLLDLRLKGLSLLWAAAAVKLVQLSEAGWAQPLLEPHGGLVPELAIWTLGVAFVAINLPVLPTKARMALCLLAVGFTLNTLVTVLNGAMPFSVQAARTAGFSEDVIATSGPLYVAVSDQTMLPVLADVIPVPLLQKVISIGDVLMFIGIAWLVVVLARHGFKVSLGRTDACGRGGVHAQEQESAVAADLAGHRVGRHSGGVSLRARRAVSLIELTRNPLR